MILYMLKIILGIYLYNFILKDILHLMVLHILKYVLSI